MYTHTHIHACTTTRNWPPRREILGIVRDCVHILECTPTHTYYVLAHTRARSSLLFIIHNVHRHVHFIYRGVYIYTRHARIFIHSKVPFSSFIATMLENGFPPPFYTPSVSLAVGPSDKTIQAQHANT